MIVHIAREEERRPNREELEHVIKRNFSGLLEDDFDPIRIIMGHVMPEKEKEYYGVKILNIYICVKKKRYTSNLTFASKN